MNERKDSADQYWLTNEAEEYKTVYFEENGREIEFTVGIVEHELG
jgi:hypothetical protein